MLTGDFTSDSLPDIFRAVSLKRRNGILSLSLENKSLNILLKEGRIVGARDSLQGAALAVAKRLVSAGCLDPETLPLIQDSKVSVVQLGELLVGKKYVTLEDFNLAKRSHELDLLYALRMIEGGEVRFTSKLVRVDPRASLGLYPGQFLLDLVELDADEERFAEVFGTLEAPKWISRVEDSPEVNLTSVEQRVWNVIDQGALLTTVARHSLLAEFEWHEALLSLHEHGLVATDEAEVHVPSPEERAADEAIAHLESAMLDVLSEHEEAESPSESAQEDSRIEDLSLTSKEGDEASASLAETEQVEDDTDSLEVVAEEKQKASMMAHPGFRELLKSGNYHVLDRDSVRGMVLAGTLIFLIAFALIGPPMFEQWFDALREFTSLNR